ncbi:MAG: DUF3849 domain-containing protein [Eubacteriales bacterium]|nr:DUF3849 domain-containing protein [Eubacteriales bacterium]
MPDRISLYHYSREEAHRNNEIELWRDSYRENVRCSRAIEEAVKQNFNGMHLTKDSPKSVIDEFGYNRTFWVLANTLQYKHYDGRFSDDNKQWAIKFFVPKDENNCYFVADSHPAVLDGFINQVRRQYQSLGLFDYSHCCKDSDHLDYENRVLVLKPEILKDEYKSPDFQLFYADGGGFGCSPKASGRKVLGQFLKDGERVYYNRNDFIGVLSDEHLPAWAAEKLEELNAPAEPEQQDGGISM